MSTHTVDVTHTRKYFLANMLPYSKLLSFLSSYFRNLKPVVASYGWVYNPDRTSMDFTLFYSVSREEHNQPWETIGQEKEQVCDLVMLVSW